MNRYIAPACIAAALSLFLLTLEFPYRDDVTTDTALSLWILQTLVMFWIIQRFFKNRTST